MLINALNVSTREVYIPLCMPTSDTDKITQLLLPHAILAFKRSRRW